MSSVQKSKVFVAMSGGVDSSVAAALLCMRKPEQSSMRKAHANYEVIGCYIKGFNLDGCAEQDVEDARRAAEVLGIPFYVFDFEKEYKEKVVEYMVEGYRQGITPNPDVMCNKEIKFGLFLKKALEMGADYVATGHYVKIRSACLPIGINQKKLFSKRQRANYFLERSPSPAELDESAERAWREGLRNEVTKSPERKASCRLRKVFSLNVAKDKNKDQSYFLWTLTQEQLRHCLFPIGNYLKSEVRQMARKFGLPNAEKKDSQGICFLGRVRLGDFLSQYIKPRVGQVRLAQADGSYRVVGEHQGAYFYTIGQRHLGINLQPHTSNFSPLYVVEKDVKENAILVAEENDPALYQKEIELKNINFINSLIPLIRTNKGYKVLARVRYRQPLVKAKLVTCHMSHVTCKLIFDSPQKFVASGQSAVFYSGNSKLIGGGVIA